MKKFIFNALIVMSIFMAFAAAGDALMQVEQCEARIVQLEEEVAVLEGEVMVLDVARQLERFEELGMEMAHFSSAISGSLGYYDISEKVDTNSDTVYLP